MLQSGSGVRFTQHVKSPTGQIAFQVLYPRSEPHPAFPDASKAPSETPLVLIQGLSAIKEDWHGLDVRLSQDRPVVIVDNRGLGESDLAEAASAQQKWSLKQMAEDVLLVVNTVFPGRRVHVMGISMGGMIAQELALLAPSTVDRLILGCTHGGGPDVVPPHPDFLLSMLQMPEAKGDAHKSRQTLAKLIELNLTPEWRAANPERFDKLLATWLVGRRPAKIIARQVACIQKFEAGTQRGREIRQPTLIIHGTQDLVVPYPNGVALWSRIPNSLMVTLPFVGHVFWDMDEGRSLAAISEFLALPLQEVTRRASSVSGSALNCSAENIHPAQLGWWEDAAGGQMHATSYHPALHHPAAIAPGMVASQLPPEQPPAGRIAAAAAAKSVAARSKL